MPRLTCEEALIPIKQTIVKSERHKAGLFKLLVLYLISQPPLSLPIDKTNFFRINTLCFSPQISFSKFVRLSIASSAFGSAITPESSSLLAADLLVSITSSAFF